MFRRLIVSAFALSILAVPATAVAQDPPPCAWDYVPETEDRRIDDMLASFRKC